MNPDRHSTHTEAIIDTIRDNFPGSGNVHEIEFLVKGPANINGGPWNLGIHNFRELMQIMNNSKDLSGLQETYMLTVQLAQIQNDTRGVISRQRLRMVGLEPIKYYCMSNNIKSDAKDVFFEKKVRQASAELEEYFLRLKYSTESPIMDQNEKNAYIDQLSQKSNTKIYRYGKRYTIDIGSYQYGVDNGINFKLKMDFTVMHEGVGPDFRAAKVVNSNMAETYEVELEIESEDGMPLSVNIFEHDEFNSDLKQTLEKLLLFLNGGVTIGTQSERIAKINSYVALCNSIFGTNDTSSVNYAMAEEIRKERNKLNLHHFDHEPITGLQQDLMNTLSSYNIAAFISSMSRDVLEKDIIANNHYFTDKADGRRALLYIDGNGETCLVVNNTIKILQKTKDHDGLSRLTAGDAVSTFSMYLTDTTLPDFTFKSKAKADDTSSTKTSTTANTDTSNTTNTTSTTSTANLVVETVSYANSILDGELLYINDEYHYRVFDILVHNGKSLLTTDFSDRLKMFNKLKSATPKGPLKIGPKLFYRYSPQEFMKFVSNLTVERSEMEVTGLTITEGGLTYGLDGIIFQSQIGEKSHYPIPKTNHNTWLNVYKWKPVYLLTVDLKIDERNKPVIIPKVEQKVEGQNIVDHTSYIAEYKLYYIDKITLVPVDAPCRVVMAGANDVPRTENGEPITRGCIVECRYSVSNGCWIPIKVRHDKSRPNGKRAYFDAITTIVNRPITLDNLSKPKGGFGDRDNLVVNKLNRIVSNELIIKLGVNVVGEVTSILDLGSGNAKSAYAWKVIAQTKRASKEKGGYGDKGDVVILGVDKEDTKGAHSVMNSDINKHKYDAKKGRSDDLLVVNSYAFVQADFLNDLAQESESASYFMDPSRFDIVSCTFAIQYAMASRENFIGFLKNVKRNLKAGGCFIGSYMSGRKVRELFNDTVTPNIRKERDVNGVVTKVSSVNASGFTIWSIRRNSATFDQNDPFKNHAIFVDFYGLYDNQLEYLIDLEDPTILGIMHEHDLELENHISFNTEVDNLTSSTVKDFKDHLNKPENRGEKIWMDLHYNFVFKKAKRGRNPGLIIKKSSATASVSTTAPVATAKSTAPPPIIPSVPLPPPVMPIKASAVPAIPPIPKAVPVPKVVKIVPKK